MIVSPVLSASPSPVAGASLIGQWCQPEKECCAAVISSQLDALAEQVRLELQAKCSDHPACHGQHPQQLAGWIWIHHTCFHCLCSLCALFARVTKTVLYVVPLQSHCGLQTSVVRCWTPSTMFSLKSLVSVAIRVTSTTRRTLTST